jgi:SNF2 family DNA or RNA helicase
MEAGRSPYASLEGRSGKLDRLSELADELREGEERTLIFTQYAEMGKLILEFLENRFGEEVLFIHGAVKREIRAEMVRRFEEDPDAPRFFVLTLKAGGAGLNLTRASHVILYDRWWNPAVEQQAIDRAFRIGQRRNVQVHTLICKGTLEERIDNILESKRAIAGQVVRGGEEILARLSTEEIKRILRYGLDRSA